MAATTFQPDECCAQYLSRELFDGVLEDATVWTCPECAMDWRARMVDEVKHWEPCPEVAIIR